MRRLRTLLRRRSRRPGTITVTLVADTRAYVNALTRAAVGIREIDSKAHYRARVREERQRGKAYVDRRLDQLCLDLGLDLATVRGGGS